MLSLKLLFLLLFIPSYVSFSANISSISKPTSYKQTSHDTHWLQAMEIELNALEQNHTWDLTYLPPGKSPIGSKWVYKTKLHPDGTVDRFKARLVAKGYHQIEGIDYNYRFSPVAKLVTVRLFFTIATTKAWHIHQLDINNAFLHGHLHEEVYMLPPDGHTKAAPGQVCRLRRSLYGLKQASRQWNLEFCSKLTQFGFTQSAHDHCLFIKRSSTSFLALPVYVDDTLITGTNEVDILHVKRFLHSVFSIKDLGYAKYFLGLEIARSPKGMFLHQRKYVLDILTDVGLLHAKTASTPMQRGHKFSTNSPLMGEPDLYRRLIGRLLYVTMTRPDITFVIQQLSQHVSAPREDHWDAAFYLLRYLKLSPSTGIFISSNNDLNLSAYCDVDWASCSETRRSLTGYCIFLGQTLVSWKIKKQATVSRSSTEAEYRSLASTVYELLWISYILRDFDITVPLPIPIWCDNQAALHIVANPVFHERTKHLDIDCHLVRDQFKLGFIHPQYIPSRFQVADLFTKALATPHFSFLCSKLGLFDPSQP